MTPDGSVRHCTRCGAPTRELVPAGEDRHRSVCTACGHVHYANPRTVAACLVEVEGGLLLCRRAIEPRVGFWTAPGGYVELGEGVQEGARRETWEEARARVRIEAPQALLDIPHIGQTYAIFRGGLEEPGFGAGAESLEVRVFALDELPWDEIAFPVLHTALGWYVDEVRRGERCVHLGVVRWSGEGDRYDPAAYAVEDHLALPLAAEAGPSGG